MINSGITRRIDDLGRIVVPKELRNNLGIRDGEPLLISTENDTIVIKKFSKVESMQEIIRKYAEIVSDITNINIIITDREKVIYTNTKLDLLNKQLDDHLKEYIDNRESYLSNGLDLFLDIKSYFVIIPMITCSDSIGLVIFYSEKNIGKYQDIAKILSKLITS